MNDLGSKTRGFFNDDVLGEKVGFNAGFNPKDIKTLHGWWSADFGIAQDGGGNISQITDKSGNGRHATQAVGSNRPLFIADGGSVFNNLPVIQYNGLTSFLSIADFDYVDYNNLNVFIVAKTGQVSTIGQVMSHGNSTTAIAWSIFINSTTNMRMQLSETGSAFQKITDMTTILTTTDAFLFSLKYNTTRLFNFLNGVDESVIITDIATTKFFDPVIGLTIGALLSFGFPSGFFRGQIPEIIITGLLTAKEEADMNNYLLQRYGI